jgi:hypothetical protein
MMGTFGGHILARYGLIFTPDESHSEILYVVIITIISAIYTLCGVPVLIWLHLSSIVINGVSHSSYGVSL